MEGSTLNQISSIPKSISTFWPGWNAGRPAEQVYQRRIILEKGSVLTEIRAARASERIAEEATPTATRRLARIQRCLAQFLPIILAHLTNTTTIIIRSRIEHDDRTTGSFLRLELCQSTRAALACALSANSTVGICRCTGGHGAHAIFRGEEGFGVDGGGGR